MSALADTGFANPRAARAIVRRMKLRRGMQAVEASAAALSDLLDHRGQPGRSDRSTVRLGGIGLSGCNDQRGIDCVAVHAIESDDEGEQQLLQGVDLILQLLDRLQVGLRHGLFSIPSAGSEGDASERTVGAHRLSEVSK